MFNLDEAIAEWRRQMIAVGIKSSETLDELENHLRDDLQQQVRSGLSAQEAFDAAVRRIGQASALEAEFTKAGGAQEAWLGKLMGIACVAFACFFSLMFSISPFRIHGVSLAQRMFGLAAVASTLLGW